jgi:hypothetical protein
MRGDLHQQPRKAVGEGVNRARAGILTLLLVLNGVLVEHVGGVGITIITHGYSGDVNGWVTAMADRIPKYQSFPGTNFTTYTITLTTDGAGNYFYQYQRTNGSAPSVTDSGEIIVKLDWSQMAGGTGTYNISTYTVARVASSVLMQTNAIPELGGHALAEFPLHLIGHSRGGSLISEMSHQLGTNGVWIDHLTTLDPHPLNNDGFYDPVTPVTDAPMHTYVNVLFHDNYWENINFYPWGESVAGAYVRPLDSSLSSDPSGGYSSYHSDVHLWYHGTIDLRTPASYSYPGDSATIDATMRSDWWVAYENSGARAGFLYGLIGAGNRLSTDQPLGISNPAIRDGYNQYWDLGAGVANNRTALDANNGAWPNLIRCNRTDTNQITQGQSVALKIYYQWASSTASTAEVSFFLDNDPNPLDGNEIFLVRTNMPVTGAAGVNAATISLPLTSRNISPGWHWLFAEISGGGRTRYLYAPERVQVLPGLQPPILDIADLDPTHFLIGINGSIGQTILLQTSASLNTWQSLLTNTLSRPRFVYTNSVVAGTPMHFYRVQLTP